MKVLNRPMFRMGGPIKEGIMHGIKEPRRGYNQAGMVFPANVNTMLPTGINAENAAKKFENIFDVNNMRPVPMMPKDNTLAPTSIEQKMKPFEKAKDVSFAVTDYFEKDMNTTDKKIPKNTRYGVVMVDNPDYGKIKRVDKVADKKETDGVVTTQGKSPFAYTADKVIEEKGKLPGDDDPPPATRKEKINSILEGLGYDRAQKNALYDAMIKAGQRISRTGLGAENLVSDVIAETSQSYDKPEKLREAANLMQVQQDLKLDQIEAGKTNTTEQTVDFLMSDKGGNKTKTEALDIVLKNPRNDDEAYDKAFAETKGDVGRAVTAAVNYAVERNLFDKPLGIIDTKKYDNPKEFFEDKTVYKGPGNYIIGGTVIEIDSKGNATTVKKYYTSKKSESFLKKFGIGTD